MASNNNNKKLYCIINYILVVRLTFKNNKKKLFLKVINFVGQFRECKIMLGIN